MVDRLLHAAEAHRRPSNRMKTEGTDLGRRLEARTFGARLWRPHPGQAFTSPQGPNAMPPEGGGGEAA